MKVDFKKKTVIPLTIALITFAFTMLWSFKIFGYIFPNEYSTKGLNFIYQVEQWLTDTIKFAGKENPEIENSNTKKITKSDIVIVGIDEESQTPKYFGVYPWPREVYAGFLGYFDLNEKWVDEKNRKLENKINIYNNADYDKLMDPDKIRKLYIEKYEFDLSQNEQLNKVLTTKPYDIPVIKKQLTTLLGNANSSELDELTSETAPQLIPELLSSLRINERIETAKKNITKFTTFNDNDLISFHKEKVVEGVNKQKNLLKNIKGDFKLLKEKSKDKYNPDGSIDPYIVFFDVFFDYQRDTPFKYSDKDTFGGDPETLYELNNLSQSDNHIPMIDKLNNYLKSSQVQSDAMFFDELKNINKSKQYIIVDYWADTSAITTMSKEESKRRFDLIKDFTIEKDHIELSQGSKDNLTVFTNVIFPIEGILNNVWGAGSAALEKTIESKVRSMPLVYKFKDPRYMNEPVMMPTIDLLCLLKYYYHDLPNSKIKDIMNNVKVIIGEKIVLKDAKVPIKEKIKRTVLYDPENNTIAKSFDISEFETPEKVQEINNEIKKHQQEEIIIEGNKIPKYELYEYDISSIKEYVKKDFEIPIDERCELYINYQGPGSSFDFVPFFMVNRELNTQDPRRDGWARFKNKTLLTGIYTSSNVQEKGKDSHSTPYGDMFGVEIHANVLHTVYTEDFIRPVQGFYFGPLNVKIDIDTILMFFAALFFGFIIPRLSILQGLIVSAITFFTFVIFGIFLFVYGNTDMPIIMTLITIISVFGGITVYRLLTEEKEKKFIRGAFSQYLSPAVIDQLVQNPDKLRLGGERKIMTAFFSDVEKFSTMSEKLKPEELVHLLNEYLTEMCDIISKYDGTVDKFEGDAIIAFWGAPIENEEHAKAACLTTIEMSEKMQNLRNLWKQEGRQDFVVNMKMRVGLNSGPMVVGNMGSKTRMDYTMMGDSVNLAARLEGANKFYGTYNMISEFTYELAKDVIEVRELDKIQVVGKEEPVKVYELLGRKGELEPNFKKGIDLFLEALQLYRNMKFSEALAKFKEVFNFIEKDSPSKTYIERCETYLQTPPPADWNGVYKLTTKG